MDELSRRSALGALAMIAGAGTAPSEASEAGSTAAEWKYAALSPAAVAAEAYRLTPDGGCMYGAFRAILTAWLKQAGRPLDSFPFHMMRYGEGGVAGWGTVCGTLNAGAAVIGLFEKNKERCHHLIGLLLGWYEEAKLPEFAPPTAKTAPCARSQAGSVLCHVSVAHWCKVSGAAPMSPAMKERCRRLTADAAAKTVEILNGAGELVLPKEEPSLEPPKAVARMNCAACHASQEAPSK